MILNLRRVGPWILAAVAVSATGCGRNEPPPWPPEVAPTTRIETELRTSWTRLDADDPGDASVVADLHAFDRLTQELIAPGSRSQASHELHERWSEHPENLLWPEIVVRQEGNLVEAERLLALFDRPACSDTTTAVGTHISAWRDWRSSLARYLEAAPGRPLPPDAFSRFWIGFRTAYAARISGNPDLAVARALAALGEARVLGGRKLEGIVWSEIGWDCLALGELDDALHAAAIADTLASLSVPEGGAMTGVLARRHMRARVLAARRDAQEAFALYESNIDLASRLELGQIAANDLHYAGTLADAIGDADLTRRFDRRALAFAIAGRDSSDIPRHLINLGRGYLFDGQPDSCRAYYEWAERIVAAFPDSATIARLPLMRAEYHLWVGNYDTADSLVEAAKGLAHLFDGVDAYAEFQLESIRAWMKIGRPDLVYRAIATNSELRTDRGDLYADRHVAADMNLLIGEFYTRRGEFALADEALDLAASALKTRENPSKQWALARNRGLLDRARHNPRGAERWFRECIRIGEALDLPDLIATGRLLLGSARLDQADYSGARDALPTGDLESSQSTRLLALLLTGVSHLRAGDPDAALAYLDRAESSCRSWTPLDMIGRVELETGRAHAARGEHDEATEYYERVAGRIRDAGFRSGQTEGLAYFTGDLRRDLVEAWLGIEPVDPGRSLEFAMDLLPRWRPVDGALRSSQVVFFVGDELSARWVVDDTGATFARLPGAPEIVEALHLVLPDMKSPGAPINRRDVRELSDLLLGGIDGAWPTGKTLHVVPDLALFGVPWAGLEWPGTGQSLVSHGPVVVLDRPMGAQKSGGATGSRLLVLVADDPDPAGLERLRHATREAEEIRAVWPDRRCELRSGAAAAEAFEPGSNLAPYRAIHVASHARVYSGRADRTTLLLGGGNSTASSIRNLHIPVDLVFLSACEAGDGGESRSAHFGLARSFQDAGARQVVAPISVIDDAAARAFAVAFYENWIAETSVAEALRSTQLAQLNGELSHPFYWAFYQVFGPE